MRSKPCIYVRCLAAVISITIAAACSGDTATSPGVAAPSVLTQLPRQLSATEQQLANSSNSFAFALFHAVDSAAGPDSNVIMSPLSASMALGMTAVGASGMTLDSMQAVLGYNGFTASQMADSYHSLITLLTALDTAVAFQISNAIWYDHSVTLVPSFTSAARSDFAAPVTAANFGSSATADAINHWVDSSTHGKITSLVDGIPPDMIVFLANAIYFHGSWRQQFDAARTRDTLFTTRTNAKVSVPMMHAQLQTRASVTSQYTAVDLPYGRDAYAMTVIVPANGVSLASVVTALRDGGWSTLAAALDANPGATRVDVALPKFTVAWGDSLNVPLASLGMGIAFSDRADFSNMTTSGAVQLSSVVQKARVEVDEHGTTAAAATGVGVILVSLPNDPTPIPVHADHPFLYVLRERLSGTVLFVGAFQHPPLS